MIGKIALSLALLTIANARPNRHNEGSELTEPHEWCPDYREHYLLPHEYDCTKFYYCEYGQKYIEPRVCSPGTVFSYDKQVCIHPTYTGCWLPGFPQTPPETEGHPEEGSPELEQVPEETPEVEQVPEASPEVEQVPEASPEVETPEESSPEAPGNENGNGEENDNEDNDNIETPEVEWLDNGCPADYNVDQLFPHPTECGKYLICVYGEKVERDCPAGLYFDPDTKDCDWSENVDCNGNGNGNVENPGPEEQPESQPDNGTDGNTDNGEDNGEQGPDNGENGQPDNGERPEVEWLPNGCPADYNVDQLFPHPTECGKYLICVYGEKVERDCPAGLYFDPDTKDCDWSENVDCNGNGNGNVENPGPEEQPESQLDNGTDENTDNGTDENTDNGTDENTDNGEDNGEQGPDNGENGQADNGERPEVEWLPNGCPVDYNVDQLFPHPTECGKYLICVYGEKVERDCPAGLYFDPDTKDCDWSENVDCNDNGNGNVENPGPEEQPESSPEAHPESEPDNGTDENTENGTDENTDNGTDENTDNGTDENTDNGEDNGEQGPDNGELPEVEWLPNGCPADYNVDQLFPHPTECGKYLICVYGEKVERDCPAGLYFDPETKDCDWPANVDCNGNGNGNVENPGPEEEPDSSPEAHPESEPDNGTDENTDNGTDENTDNGEDNGEQGPDNGTDENTDNGEDNGEQGPDNGTDENTDNGEDNGEQGPDNGTDENTDNGEDNGEQGPDNGTDENTDNGEDNGEQGPDNGTDENTDNGEDNGENHPDNGNTDEDTDNGEQGPDNGENGQPDNGERPEVEWLDNGCPADWHIHHLVPHEADCGKFYYCVYGQLVERQCSGGLHFNPVLQVCDWPENAGCQNGGDNGENPGTDGNPDNGNTDEDTNNGGNNGENHPDNGENGQPDNGENGQPDNGENGQPDNGDRPEVELLDNGCPADWHIHHLVPHEADCGKFYYCVYGQLVERECSGGLHFNPVLQVCDWPENAGCQNGGDNGENPGTDGNPDNGNEEDEDNNSNGNGTDENTDNGEDNGEQGPGNSENGQPDNGDRPEVEWLDNGCPADWHIHHLVPHEADCGKFYYCVYGQLVERECSGGLHFNPVLQVCDWPQDAGCQLDGGNGENTDTEENIDNGNGNGEEDNENNGNGEEDNDNNGNGEDDNDNNGNGEEDNGNNGNGEEDNDNNGNGEEDNDNNGNGEEDNDNNGNGGEDNDNNGNGSEDSSDESNQNRCRECNVGDWAHETDCDKYWRCEGDRAVLLSCAEGLHFNGHTKTCDFMANAGCTREFVSATFERDGTRIFLPWTQMDREALKLFYKNLKKLKH